MMRIKTVSLKHFIFYFLFSAIHLTAILSGNGFKILSSITKPLLMPALMIVFYRLTSNRENPQRKFVLAALMLSWFGDVSLMLQEKNSVWFLIGLVCFLIAHLSYIMAFTRNNYNRPEASHFLLRKKPWLTLLFVAYAIAIFFMIHEGLGDMLIPVIVYMCVILLMGMSALNRFGKVSSRSFAEVFCGALIFMLSDSLLAINKFSQPITSASFLIMLTYITAQFFIVKGMIDEAAAKQSL